MARLNRRSFLLGLGGAVVGLPMLEGLRPKEARADDGVPSFALFYRRGNGVQQALFDGVVTEAERWWPSLPFGAITPASLAGASTSAMSVLSGYASRLGIIKGLRHPVGSQLGHREGFIQGLTGAGVAYPVAGQMDPFNCDPLGESLDNRIARDLTPATPTSLFMGLGMHDAGGVSFLNAKDAQGKQITRAAEENLVALYNRLFLPAATDAETRQLLLGHRKSVNDLVRADLLRLRSDKRLSKSDRDRLDLHTSAIRDTEIALTCTLPPTVQGDVQTYQNVYDGDPDWFKGNSVRQAAQIMGKLAALAVACGVSRSILINMGVPQDTTPYNQVPEAANEDFHSISHRMKNDDDPNTKIPNADVAHHMVDRFHLENFRLILDQLDAYAFGDGSTLLDKGVAVHFSDLGTGQHLITMLPYLYVGGAGGNLKTGLYVNEPGTYLVKFLNTIGAAVGLKNAAGNPLDDFNADNNGGRQGRLPSISNV